MADLLKPRPDDIDQVWTVEIDGKKIECRHVKLSSRFGTIEQGVGDEGYDRVAYHQPGGGGSVMVPYVMINDIPHIGVIRMNRSDTLGEEVCSPGAFLKENETHEDTARGIIVNELGLSANSTFECIGAVSQDRSFMETSGDGEGVHYYAMEIPFDQIEEVDEIFVLKDGIAKPPDAGLQQITSFEFHPCFEITKFKDGFIATAVGLLHSFLAEEKSEEE